MIVKYRKRVVRDYCSAINRDPYGLYVEFQYLLNGKWRLVHHIIRYRDEDTMLMYLANKQYVERTVREAMEMAVRDDLHTIDKEIERIEWQKAMKENLKSFDREGEIEIED